MADKKETVLGDCKERVAYDLMELILDIDKGVKPGKGKDHILDVYAECLAVVDRRARVHV